MCTARCVGALGAPEAVETASFPSTKEAAAGVQQLCRKAAAVAATSFESDVQRRGMLEQGPLTAMDNAELKTWVQLLSVRLEVRDVLAHGCSACHSITLLQGSTRSQVSLVRDWHSRNERLIATLPHHHLQFASSALLWRTMAEAEVKARKQKSGLSAEAEFTVEDSRDVAPVGDVDSVRGRLEEAARRLSEEAGASGAGADGAAEEVVRRHSHHFPLFLVACPSTA